MTFGVESLKSLKAKKPTAENSTSKNLHRKRPIFVMENIFL